MRPDRATNIESWSVDALTLILLRQFKRLFVERGVNLTDAEMQSISEQVMNRALPPQPALITALNQIIGESLTVLNGWGFSFGQSLATDMTNLTHLWQTTADFLSLANEKGNAEIRISAGSALLALLGDFSHVDKLMTAINHDMNTAGALDVDAMLCKRALCHVAHIAPDDADWLHRAQIWADGHKV
ncbi:MAG: hypothetical protein MUE54_12455 [Anaerolineae bacterium]|jgi:hypothetical protein|nr:hypothetical protein [Anaerolineae bacterium]